MIGRGITDEHTSDPDGSDVLISIVNYRTPRHCIACLISLVGERRRLPGLRVVVADGASEDGSVAALTAWIERCGHREWITVLPLGLNGGFGWAHNQVMLRALQCDAPPAYIHLLNPDTLVEPGAVAALRRVFDADPRIACVGSQLVNGEGGLQPAGFRFPKIRTELGRGARTTMLVRLMQASEPIVFARDKRQEVPAVSGASFMVRAPVLREVGMFDDGFFLYFEEFELMQRFGRSGWKIVQEPSSRVHHVGGAATKLSRDSRVLAQFARPFYWYQSQRRYLYRTMGPARARLAALAWLLGYTLIALPRAAISADFRTKLIKREARDMLKAWRSSERFECQAFVTYPGDTLDQPPAWRNRLKQ